MELASIPSQTPYPHITPKRSLILLSETEALTTQERELSMQEHSSASGNGGSLLLDSQSGPTEGQGWGELVGE